MAGRQGALVSAVVCLGCGSSEEGTEQKRPEFLDTPSIENFLGHSMGEHIWAVLGEAKPNVGL